MMRNPRHGRRDDDRKPTEEELDQMRALARQAMEDGAVGVSGSNR